MKAPSPFGDPNRLTAHPMNMRRVVVESPFSGDVQDNLAYARACLRDCLLRDESPVASHVLFAATATLDDSDPVERAVGINAGHAWMHGCHAVVVYTDRGISKGMEAGIRTASFHNIPVEHRTHHTKCCVILNHTGQPSGPTSCLAVPPRSMRCSSMSWHCLHREERLSGSQNSEGSPLWATLWCTTVASHTLSRSAQRSHRGCLLRWATLSRFHRSVPYHARQGYSSLRLVSYSRLRWRSSTGFPIQGATSQGISGSA